MENAADARLAPPPPFPWIPPLATYITGPVVAESEQESALKAIVEAVTASMPPGSRQRRRVCQQVGPDGGVDGEDGPLVIFLQTLGPYLTHEDDVKRTRAITLLSRVLMAAPGLVTTSYELHHLAEFYTSRLMDWPAIRGALEGCLVLADFTDVDEDGDGSDGDAVRQAAASSGNTSTSTSTNANAKMKMKTKTMTKTNNNGEKAAFAGLKAGFFGPSPSKTPARRPPAAAQATRLPPQAPRFPLQLCYHDVVALAETIVDSVYVRSLAAHDRSLVFTLISKLATAYGDLLLGEDVDLAELMVVSMDGEKDPGCLFDAFQALQAVCGAFCRFDERDVALEMMRKAEEELFDVLACYFPVSFEPKERSARGITREDLARGLEACLLAWPGFYDDALDMLEEKMGSIVKQAKVDSMRLLAGLCARSEKSSPRRVWSMLRGDVVGASEFQFFGKEHPIVLSTLAQCLTGHGRNGGNEGLGREVLGDVVVGDCMSCLDPDVEGYSESKEGAAFERQVGLTRSTALIFRACALAGGPVWRRAVDKHAIYLAELFLYHVRSTNVPQMCFTLLLLYALLADVGQLSGSADCATTKKTDEWGNAIRFAYDVLGTHILMYTWLWGAKVGADDPLAWTATTGECSFVWPTDPAEYNFAVLLATFARSLEAISCFDDMWVNKAGKAGSPGFVLACRDVMRVDHEGVAAVARCALENVCASSPGRRHDVTKKAVGLLLRELGGGDGNVDGGGGGNGGGNGDGEALPRSAVDAIFQFLASVCVEDGERGPSRRPAVLKELRERLTSAEDLARGLVILEGEPDSAACAEEVAVLEEILTRVGAAGSPDSPDSPESSEQTDASVARASFGVCKRMTREDQRRVLRDRLATLGNGRCDSALLGCVLGLYPDVAADHRGLLRALVTLSTGTKNSELARYAAASVANKTAATDPDGVLEALDALIASSPEGEPESVEVFLNALAKQGGDVIEGALQRVVATGRSAALRSLVGSPADTDASSRTDAYISAQSHATVAFLWEQKAYTKAKRCLMSAEADHTAALVYLIAGLPPALVRTDKAFVCAQLCAFLERIPLDDERALLADVGVDEQSLERVLRVFEGLIALPETAERVGAFLPVLLHLVLHARYAGARQAALECLAQISRDIPYQTIHPYRRAIVKTVVAACDDRKRAVRATAVSCRELY